MSNAETATRTDAPAASPAFSMAFMKFVVEDVGALQAFYENAFGFQGEVAVDTDDVFEILLKRPDGAPGTTLVLFAYKDGRKIARGDAYGPVAFYVDDADAVYARLLANGAAPERPPFSFEDLRVAFVRDPEGREIELISRR